MSALLVAAWVYIGLFVFFAGFWAGAWLWWRECERRTERVRDKAIAYLFRTTGAGIGQLAMFYADLGGKGGDTRGKR